MKTKKILVPILIIILILFTSYSISMARTGGAGDFSGGSYSSGGGFSDSGDGDIGTIIYIVIQIFRILPFPLNVIVSIIFIGLVIYLKRQLRQSTVYNKLHDEFSSSALYNSGVGNIQKNNISKEFVIGNNNFNQEAFVEKVKKIFFEVQEGWEKQDISKIRKIISDGVYQRFTTQFKMMRLLKQENKMEKVELKDVFPIKMYTDGNYDVIDVRIIASNFDRFICALDPSLNQEGFEEYIEYWTFVRKQNSKQSDMYHNDNCPNCGAPLPNNMGEVSKCEYCNSILNSGEFDWVLSEITQATDYVESNIKIRANAALKDNVLKLQEQYEDFSIQLMEDKASNAYLQIMTTRATKDPAIMRRFVSDKAFEKIKNSFDDNYIVYNRLYLNDVSILGIFESDTQNILAISISSSFQRVKFTKGVPEKLDPSVMKRREVLIMTRDKNSAKSKGLLYMHNCPNCGAPVNNTIDINCEYCQSPLNSSKFEWIVEDIMDLQEYQGFSKMFKSDSVYTANVNLLDSMLDVRDFAFNNLLVMAYIDGICDNDEKEFALQVAKKFGYNQQKIRPLITMAQYGQLVIKMPLDMKARNKIYKLMERTAVISGGITPKERELLDSIKQEYLQV